MPQDVIGRGAELAAIDRVLDRAGINLSAAANVGDSSDRRAKVVPSSVEDLITSDRVLIKSWLLIRHRLGRTAAERIWAAIRGRDAALEPVGTADLEVAWSIGQAYPDQDFSIVDRTGFAVIERLGVPRAATFDADFAVCRFGLRRERAFKIAG